jgi:Tol biopolymer transport system component
VVFESLATNLLGVNGDTNRQRDIYRRNLVAGTTLIVSVAADGRQTNEDSFAPAVTDDGRRVVFHTAATTLNAPPGISQVFLKDVAPALQTVTLVSVAADGLTLGNGDSQRASISGDGRFVAFDSAADNLVLADSEDVGDVFVKAIASDAIIRVSIAEDGFTEADAPSLNAAISANGRYIVFESDASNLVLDDFNGLRDVFRGINVLF